MKRDHYLEVLIEDLTEDEAKLMMEAITEIAEKYDVEITELQSFQK
ncbi:MAG: hypothetical protein RBT15_04760 [Gudongella sp.]|jgi:hypothetical protein|nr:hypothetical protein [Gudongella sp.]